MTDNSFFAELRRKQEEADTLEARRSNEEYYAKKDAREKERIVREALKNQESKWAHVAKLAQNLRTAVVAVGTSMPEAQRKIILADCDALMREIQG